MSIEKDLTRIADALEELVKTMQQNINPVFTTAPAKPKKTKVAKASPTTVEDGVTVREGMPPVVAAPVVAAPVVAAPVVAAPVVAAPVVAAPVVAAPVVAAPVVAAPVVAAPVVAAPVVAAPVQMTPEDLNAAIIVEFKRIGGREPIDAVMTSMGIDGITSAAPEQYQPLLDAVRAIQV